MYKNEIDVKEGVMKALYETAPEIDAMNLREDDDLREKADLDSLDFLNFIGRLNKIFNVQIQEKNFDELRTLEGCVALLRGLSQQKKD